jgi:putative peptide zinc metalloprotease protein
MGLESPGQAQAKVKHDPDGVPETPALAPGVQLVGQMQDAGYVEQQWLIQRDGKFIQVGELLYRVAELADGRRTLEGIAGRMTETSEWMVTADHVRQLVAKLIPLGVITAKDGVIASPATGQQLGQAQAGNALGIHTRTKVIGPHVIEPLAKALQFLYLPPVLITVLALASAAHGWFYLVHGATDSIMDLLYRPWALPAILGLMILGGFFHELGHAAALRYGGGQVRGIGVGIYLLYPAFFTDVTDAYRLGRWARVRTDLGGFYFYLIFALFVMLLYRLTGAEFLLFTVILINLDILYQLLPIVRLDGYWALADLTGVPDFISLMGPFVASVLPLPGWKGERLPKLNPRAKAIFIIYSLVTIPLLIFGMLFMIIRLPRFLATLWDSILYQAGVFGLSRANGDLPGMIVMAFSMFLLSVMIVGSLYLFYIVLSRLGKALWNWSRLTVKRRFGGATIALGVVALVGFVWSPNLYLFTKSPPSGVQSYEVESRNHVKGVIAYEQNPPAGGDHAPIWQNCGFYDEPVRPEHAVHSMEHGAVWVTYRQDLLAPQEVLDLRKMAYRQIYMLVSPNPEQTSAVVATAWGNQLHLDSIDDPRLDQFVRAFRLGSQAPESGEACTGGIGIPR